MRAQSESNWKARGGQAQRHSNWVRFRIHIQIRTRILQWVTADLLPISDSDSDSRLASDSESFADSGWDSDLHSCRIHIVSNLDSAAGRQTSACDKIHSVYTVAHLFYQKGWSVRKPTLCHSSPAKSSRVPICCCGCSEVITHSTGWWTIPKLKASRFRSLFPLLEKTVPVLSKWYSL